MGVRFKAALTALAVVLLITLACLAFMPWKMNTVITELPNVNRCMILRYDHESYISSYPYEEDLEKLAAALSETTGTFDRKRSSVSADGVNPIYRVYLWTEDERIPDLWVCGQAFYYDGSQFRLSEASASTLNDALQDCFS